MMSLFLAIIAINVLLMVVNKGSAFVILKGLASGLGVDFIPLLFIPTFLLSSLLLMAMTGIMPFFYGLGLCSAIVATLAISFCAGSMIVKKLVESESLDEETSPDSMNKESSSIMSSIETMSLLIRPVTLTVRFSANITNGHVILDLVGRCFDNITNAWLVLPWISYYEIIVCVIQATVFSMLVFCYYRWSLNK